MSAQQNSGYKYYDETLQSVIETSPRGVTALELPETPTLQTGPGTRTWWCLSYPGRRNKTEKNNNKLIFQLNFIALKVPFIYLFPWGKMVLTN